MSPGLSASMAEVAAMSDSAFRKRFRSSYESLPSSSPPDLPLRKRYRGTSKLVEDDDVEEDDKEGDDKEEDEEMKESSDFDNLSKDAEDEGPTIEDDDPAAGDEGLAAGDEGPSMGVESLSLGGDEAVPRGQQRAASVAETAVGEPLGLGYRALRRWEIALGEGRMPSVFEVVYIDVPAYPPPAPPAQTPLSLEWSSGSLPISPAPSIVPSPISSPMIPLTVPSPVVSPAMAETKGFLTELRCKGIDSSIWRPALAMESWAGQTDAQRAAMWHAISDTQRANRKVRDREWSQGILERVAVIKLET
ncbi:hypothetical protein Tco_1411799 [Tanacetum coccineum]